MKSVSEIVILLIYLVSMLVLGRFILIYFDSYLFMHGWIGNAATVFLMLMLPVGTILLFSSITIGWKRTRFNIFRSFSEYIFKKIPDSKLETALENTFNIIRKRKANSRRGAFAYWKFASLCLRKYKISNDIVDLDRAIFSYYHLTKYHYNNQPMRDYALFLLSDHMILRASLLKNTADALEATYTLHNIVEIKSRFYISSVNILLCNSYIILSQLRFCSEYTILARKYASTMDINNFNTALFYVDILNSEINHIDDLHKALTLADEAQALINRCLDAKDDGILFSLYALNFLCHGLISTLNDSPGYLNNYNNSKDMLISYTKSSNKHDSLVAFLMQNIVNLIEMADSKPNLITYNRAILIAQTALKLGPEYMKPDYSCVFTVKYADALSGLFDLTGDIANLEAAIGLVKPIPEPHNWQINCAVWLLLLSEATGDDTHLAEATRYCERMAERPNIFVNPDTRIAIRHNQAVAMMFNAKKKQDQKLLQQAITQIESLLADADTPERIRQRGEIRLAEARAALEGMPPPVS